MKSVASLAKTVEPAFVDAAFARTAVQALGDAAGLGRILDITCAPVEMDRQGLLHSPVRGLRRGVSGVRRFLQKAIIGSTSEEWSPPVGEHPPGWRSSFGCFPDGPAGPLFPAGFRLEGTASREWEQLLSLAERGQVVVLDYEGGRLALVPADHGVEGWAGTFAMGKANIQEWFRRHAIG
ncbi:MAG: hypothetical protein GMKNLPBB_01917 [Myxococcota bacterium]|nr:hypothetical protein [Myxococcota bacterium]